MRESVIEAYLVKRVKAKQGEVRKVQWVGRRGAPDRLVMLPSVGRGGALATGEWVVYEANPSTTWVELKATGVKPEGYQLREHARMRAMGQHVVVVDSFEAVDQLLGD